MAISRRDFFRDLGLAAGATALFGKNALATDKAVWPYAPYKSAQVVVCKGGQYLPLLAKAFDKLGGLRRYIPDGATVLVKPNIGWDRTPEYAATTNPWVVAAVIKLVLEAGAKEVRVFDNPCDDGRRTYDQSGIADAARAAGAKVSYVDTSRGKTVALPAGVAVQKAEIYAEVFDCDVIINVPIAKDHGIAGLTLGMKNLMGLLVEGRGRWHNKINQKLVDLAQVITPTLTVIDASRIMTGNGPSGGDLGLVKKLDQLIVTADVTAADAYAATLFGMDPADLGVVREAQKREWGTADLASMDVITVS